MPLPRTIHLANYRASFRCGRSRCSMAGTAREKRRSLETRRRDLIAMEREFVAPLGLSYAETDDSPAAD